MQDDEIDLFELFNTLWMGKLLILATTLVALSCGSGYVFVKSQSPYSVLSQVDLEVFEMPEGFSSADVQSSFARAFFSMQSLTSFSEVNDVKNLSWKPAPAFRSATNNRILVFKGDLIPLALSDDFTISVWSKNPKVPLLIERYAREIADELSTEYVAKVKSRRDRIADTFSKLTSLPEVAAKQVIEADDFFDKLSDGSSIVKVQAPTKLQSTIKRDLILALSVVLGVFVGCASVLTRHAIRVTTH